MSLKETLDKELDKLLKDYPKSLSALKFLRDDFETNRLLEIANTVTVYRMGYNDHGPVHSRIVAFNSAKALLILSSSGISPSILKEYKKANLDDALEAVIFAAYLHDIGNAVLREKHEIWGAFHAEKTLSRYYSKDKDSELNLRKKCIIEEGILCHMGNFAPVSLEGKIIPIADACDMEQGRARIPYQLGKKDIHSLSALSIKKVRIKSGAKKPLKVYVEMDSSAGIFQVEELLLKKIKAAGAENLVEVEASIASNGEVIHYLDD